MDWFILRVAGRRTEWVMSVISRENCWRPLQILWTKPARKHKPIPVQKPLIPGWLFVRSSQYGLWEDLEGVYGVLRYGRLGTIWMADGDLDGLRSACITSYEAPQGVLDGEVARIPRGTTVKLRGLLFGRSGTLVQYEGDSGYVLVDTQIGRVKISSKLIEQA